MKISLCTNVFPLEQIPQACVRLKAMGYDGVELWHQFLVSRPLEQIRREILGLGLSVTQLCPYFNVTGTREELQDSYRLAEEYVRMADALQCPNIRVFTGNVSAAAATEEQYAQGVEGLRNICAAGGQNFVLETHPGSLMETPEQTLRLIRDVGADNLRVNLQVPMAASDHDPYTCAELLGPYVVHLHAHNWRGSKEHLTCLGDGDYDFERFLRILRRYGFDGAVSIEHANHLRGEDPFQVAATEAVYLRQVFSRLETEEAK